MAVTVNSWLSVIETNYIYLSFIPISTFLYLRLYTNVLYYRLCSIVTLEHDILWDFESHNLKIPTSNNIEYLSHPLPYCILYYIHLIYYNDHRNVIYTYLVKDIYILKYIYSQKCCELKEEITEESSRSYWSNIRNIQNKCLEIKIKV